MPTLQRYRATITFSAGNDQDALRRLTSNELIDGRVMIYNLDRRRTIKLAVILGVVVAFWVVIACAAWRLL